MAVDKTSDTSNIGEGLKTQSCTKQVPPDKDAARRGCAEMMLRHLYQRQAGHRSLLPPPLTPLTSRCCYTKLLHLLLLQKYESNRTGGRWRCVGQSLRNASRHLEKIHRVHKVCYLALLCVGRRPHRGSNLTQDHLWECYFSIVCSRGVRRGEVGPRALGGKFVSRCTVARKAGDSPGTGLL